MKFYEAQKAIAIDNHLVQDKSILFPQAVEQPFGKAAGLAKRSGCGGKR